MVAAPFQDVDQGGQPPLAAAAPTAAAAATDAAGAVDGILAAVDFDDAGILSFPETTTCAVAAAATSSERRRRLLLLLPSDRRDEGGSLVAVGRGGSWDHGLGFRMDCCYSPNSTARQRCAGIAVAYLASYPKNIVGLVEIRVLFAGPRLSRDARASDAPKNMKPHFAGQSK